MERKNMNATNMNTSNINKDECSCEYIHIHQDIVDKVNENMPAEEVLFELAEFF